LASIVEVEFDANRTRDKIYMGVTTIAIQNRLLSALLFHKHVRQMKEMRTTRITYMAFSLPLPLGLGCASIKAAYSRSCALCNDIIISKED
jgi:hypothetical protein